MNQKIDEDIAKNGFLSKHITQQTGMFNEDNKDFFEISYELNRLCHEHKYKANVKNDQHVSIYLMSLYLRVLDLFASIIILTEKGLYKDAGILLRTMFELTVYMKKTSVDESFLEKSHEAHLLNKHRMLNAIINSSNEKIKKSFPIELISESRTAIEQSLNMKRIEDLKSINIEVVAKEKLVNLEKEYIEIFRFFSNETHSGYRSIHDYIAFENNLASEFILEHPKETGKYILKTNSVLLVYCADFIVEKFRIEHSDYLKLRQKFELLLVD